jgi:hypothetical protein
MYNDFVNLLALIAASIIAMSLLASWYFDYWGWWDTLLGRSPW